MKYTGADVERVLTLYKTTLLSTREVADRTGVGRGTVHEWVKNAGISRSRNASRQKPESKKQKGLALYRSGKSTVQIADELEVSQSTVKRWVHSAGIMRSVSYATSLGQQVHTWSTIKKVHTLRTRGCTYKEISCETGVPVGSIHNLLKRFEQQFSMESKRYRKQRTRKNID